MAIANSVGTRSHTTPVRVRRAPLTALLLVIAACSSGQNSPGMAGSYDTGRKDGGMNGTGGRTQKASDSGVAGDADVSSGTCTIGDSRACRVVLGIYKGQESCFVGMQYCDTGTWTSCIDSRDAS